MKYRVPTIQKKEPTTQSAFFAKESDQSFFGGTDSFFANQPSPNNKLAVQHKCAECEQEEKIQKKEDGAVQENGPAIATASPQAGSESFQNTAAVTAHIPVAGHIVDDNAIPEAGQMRKAVFLERLKTEVCETVNQALAGTLFSSDNCPYIRASFERHQNSSPAQIEALIIRYCPAAANVHNAEDMIQQMKIKVYAAALQWAHNGGDLSGAAQIFGGMAGSIVSAAGNIASRIGSMFFKENAGGATVTQSPQSVMQSLGKGNSIEGGTRSKMEGAFGTGLSDVEIHTDSNAAQLSKDMNARAFTVGNHIAFAGGEYQPGTITGDALMAHELAHTIQQDNRKAGGAQMKGRSEYNALEEDADSTAVNVMTKLTGRDDLQLKNKVNKGLKTGLTISRCGSSGSSSGTPQEKTSKPAASATPAVVPPAVVTTPLKKPSEMSFELAGATRTKWRVDFSTKKQAQDKIDWVRKLNVKAEEPEQIGKLWTFYYFPLTETEANTAKANKEKQLGDKYTVQSLNDSIAKTYYLKISLKCPEAVPVKTGSEIWPTCYDEEGAKAQVKIFKEAKIKAEVFELDKSLFSVYFSPLKTEADAKTAGDAEAKTRGGYAEGMFTVSASENKSLKSYTYSIATGCPAGYEDLGDFHITGYALAQETEFPAEPKVTNPCGLTGTFSDAFLNQTSKPPRGVKMQGSGLTKTGKYVQYISDTNCFKFSSCPLVKGVCLSAGKSVATDLGVIPRRSELLIEDIGHRVAEDTGGSIKGKDVDVYYGTEKTLAEANLVNMTKKVCKKK